LDASREDVSGCIPLFSSLLHWDDCDVPFAHNQVAVIMIGQSLSDLGIIQTANAYGTVTLCLQQLLAPFMSVDAAALRMFGYNRRDLIGKNIDVLVPEPMSSAHHSYMTKYIQTGREVCFAAFYA
jgi:PAS fold